MERMRPSWNQFPLVLWVLVGVSLHGVALATDASSNPLKRREEFPLLDQLFPQNSITDAWERYPLVSRARVATTAEEEEAKKEKTDGRACDSNATLAGTIPTVFVPSSTDDTGALNRTERLELTHSLLDMETILPDVLVPKFEKKGMEARVVRLDPDTLQADWYVDHLPPDGYWLLESWDQVKDIVFQQGYSLILDDIKCAHAPIARFADFVYQETGTHKVTVNMYMTPQGSKGFPPHIDAKEVLVVQLAGRKLWRVAREPIQYLATPTMDAFHGLVTEQEAQDTRSYEEFILEPGDVLYMPRGFVHNATSVPRGEDEAEQPSLHLTIGIEHGGISTFEGYLQYGVELFGKSNPNIHSGRQIKFNECPEPSKLEDLDVWLILLHLAIARVTFRLDCDACSTMRKAVPHGEIWKQVYSERMEETTGKQLSFEQSLRLDLFKMMQELVADTTLEGILTFLQSMKDTGTSLDYAGQPDFVKMDGLACFLNAEIDEDLFLSIVRQYAAFVIDNQEETLQHFESERKTVSDEISWNHEHRLWKLWKGTRDCSIKYPLALRFSNHTRDCAPDSDAFKNSRELNPKKIQPNIKNNNHRRIR